MNSELDYLLLAEVRTALIIKHEEVIKQYSNISLEQVAFWEAELERIRKEFTNLEKIIKERREELVKNLASRCVI